MNHSGRICHREFVTPYGGVGLRHVTARHHDVLGEGEI